MMPPIPKRKTRAPPERRGPRYRTFADLIARHDGNVTVACDTEFLGPHTLTIQFAARLGEDLLVQVYSSPAIPGQPDPEELKPLLTPGIEAPGWRVVIREGRRITADLSPGLVLADLFGLRGVAPMDRGWVDEDEPNGPDGALTVTLVGHFWRADFFRVFGRRFFDSLVEHQIQGGRLAIQDRRLLCFREAGGYRSGDPVLGYAVEEREDGRLYAIRVRYFDTCLAFGNRASLDDLARTFVGVGKPEGFGQAEKADMLRTFRREPGRAYAYAVQDAVLTLLVKEQMEATHRQMYEALGFSGADIPALPSTQGSRVAEMIVRCVAGDAEGSVVLSGKRAEGPAGGGDGTASLAKVKALLDKGAARFFAEEHLSRFGEQTGQTHGGLCFSRSPTRLFHPAPGMLADVDLSGCYARVMGSMSLYAGRPLVHEPGRDGGPGGVRMTLKDAVAFLNQHAAGWDAWVIKVSGQIAAWPNVLIPSTKGALTNANYKSRVAKRRAAAQWTRLARQAARHRFPLDRLDEVKKDTANTAIYTDVIEAGVVAWPTWLMIRALPPRWRAEYEALEVDSILFYPKKMVAGDGPALDALVEKYRHGGTPWTATIDMGTDQRFWIEQTVKWRADEDHVALRFDIGRLARALQQRREEAKRSGKGSAAERGYKEQVNSLYGVLASRHLPSNNVVAANVITATARALAFAMQLSLNGLQVVTDGCAYRRDQVPAGTLAECLAACPDYPINRADFGGPFLDPATIPQDDTAFTAWYRGHVRRFLGVGGPDYDALFGLHALEHKKCGDPGRTTFDGLCCDGSANYVKLLRDGKGWKPAGELKDAFKARWFGAKAKEAVADWLVRAYAADAYHGPPPVAESATKLAFKEAGQVARDALKALDAERLARWAAGSSRAEQPPPAAVYYPLGLERRRVMTYKLIKPSAFLFRHPRQQAAFVRAMGKFAQSTSCGLELLAPRRGCEGRRRGSIADVAEAVYRLIRRGVVNPTCALNLTRTFPEREEVQTGYHQEVQARKEAALVNLIRTLDEGAMDEAATLTGLFVRQRDVYRFT
jgi:hypothetical protein